MYTPLHCVARVKHSGEVIKILLEAGADINAVCGVCGGVSTPLSLAISYGMTQNVKILLENGANCYQQVCHFFFYYQNQDLP